MYMYIWIVDGVHCNDGLFFNFLCACVLTANVQTENCSAISLFALQIYGAAVADNLDKNRGVLNRRYFRQVRSLSVFKVQAPVVQRLDNAIQRINRYPVDEC